MTTTLLQDEWDFLIEAMTDDREWSPSKSVERRMSLEWLLDKMRFQRDRAPETEDECTELP